MKPNRWLFSVLLVVRIAWAGSDPDELDEEFLEFLAQWETADGEWIAPDEVASLSLPDTDDDDIEEMKEIEAVSTQEIETIDETE